jgi:hypothetical protein
VSAAARIIEGHPGPVRAFLTLAPFLIGFYPLTGLINPFWGTLIGFPLYLAAAGHGVSGPHPWTEFAAFFLWPLVMLALLSCASGALLQSASRWRTAAVVVWAASAVAVVPFDRAMTLFIGWPIYGAFE